MQMKRFYGNTLNTEPHGPFTFFFVLDVCFLFWFHWALKHLQAHLQNIVLSFLFSFFVVYFFFSGSCTSSCGKHYLLSDSSAVDPHTHCAFNAAASLGVVTGCHCEIAFKSRSLAKIFFSAILKVFLHPPFSPHWNVFSCSFFFFLSVTITSVPVAKQPYFVCMDTMRSHRLVSEDSNTSDKENRCTHKRSRTEIPPLVEKSACDVSRCHAPSDKPPPRNIFPDTRLSSFASHYQLM